MKINLIAPQTPFLAEIAFPPLNLLYLKSYLNMKGYNDTKLIDLSLNDQYSNIPKANINIITATTPQFPYAIELSSKLKETNPDSISIIGGAHTTVDPDSCNLCKSFDKIIVGDGELALIQCLEDIKKVNQTNNQTNRVYIGTPISNLDDIPFPDRSYIYDKYKYYINGKLSTIMLTSRGCPYSCYFCTTKLSKPRLHSIDYINKELQDIQNIGYEGVYFEDDIFLLRSDRDLQKLDILKELAWKCQIRPDTSLSKINILSKLNCKEVAIGLESGSEKILSIVNKKVNLNNLNKIVELTKLLRDSGIRTRIYIIVGLPSESHQTIKQTIDLLRQIEPDSVGVGTFVPYPGTYIYNNIEKFDIKIEERDYSKWFFRAGPGKYRCIVSTSNLTAKEILEYRNQIDSEFNKQPS